MTDDAPRVTPCACEVCEVAREARRRVSQRAQEAAELAAYRNTFAGQMELLRAPFARLALDVRVALLPVVDLIQRSKK